MPLNPGVFRVAQGPTGITHYFDTVTCLTPATTSETAPIKAMEPLKRDRTSAATFRNTIALHCADNDIPDLIAIHRDVWPNHPVGCVEVPQGNTANLRPVKAGSLKLPVSNPTATPAGVEWAVCADGLGTWKLVLPAAGIGRVREVVDGFAVVEF
jgi:hypothetical protein